MPVASADPDTVRSTVRREIMRFALPGIVAMAVLAVASLAVSVAVARDQSLRDAETTAQWLARTVVAPRLDDQLSQGRPKRIAQLDSAFATSVPGSDVVAVRLWNDDGIMLYSDDPRLLGERFPSRPAADDGLVAEDADLSRPENRYLDPTRETVQVTLPVTGDDGSRYVFQINTLRNTIQSDARRIWIAFAPVVVGSLAILAALLLVLAVHMARRISNDLRTRQDLLQQAIDASDLERRRIAADLHDGTVQEVAGLTYTLAGLSSRARTGGDEAGAELLSEAAASSQTAVRQLRSLLVDIYPPDLSETGLAAAVAEQLNALDPAIRATADIIEPEGVDDATRAVLYRIAREALANVAKHSDADTVQVRLGERNGQVELTVVDDGRGFDPHRCPDGHLGLRLIRDLADSSGGILNVTSSPGAGTRVEYSRELP